MFFKLQISTGSIFGKEIAEVKPKYLSVVGYQCCQQRSEIRSEIISSKSLKSTKMTSDVELGVRRGERPSKIERNHTNGKIRDCCVNTTYLYIIKFNYEMDLFH